MNIPRVMSTQHPDNAQVPFFARHSVLEGDDEIREAYYAYAHLACKEQLWDYEGKEVDAFVVKKLLSNYEHYFKKHQLGKEMFLTLRVPNPDAEKNEAKVLLETLESIPRNFDAASAFYQNDIPPIFEVAVPMTKSHHVLHRIKRYYEEIVVGKNSHKLQGDTITISDWIGKIRPETVNPIPLIEDKESVLSAHTIVKNYLQGVKTPEYQRVWLARSDPALNYGSIGAVLMIKVALQRLKAVEAQLSVPLHPMIGCGSAPFRGNFKPTNVASFLKGYPSVQTFTIQSAFKYDYEEKQVRSAIELMNDSKASKPVPVDEERTVAILEKVSAAYQRQVIQLAPMINTVARHVPERRKRKLHIGLFGYSRSSNGVKLPRAIKFCASLYSLGFPPELLGLDALTAQDLEYIRDIYAGFDTDMQDALRLLNKDNLHLFPLDVVKHLPLDIVPYETDQEHKEATDLVAASLGKETAPVIEEHVVRAAMVRRFLG